MTSPATERADCIDARSGLSRADRMRRRRPMLTIVAALALLVVTRAARRPV